MSQLHGKRIGVIGGGLGGLAAACTLSARGHRVVPFERNDWLGGKEAVLVHQDFRFDMGPTIITLPQVLRWIFAEAKRELSQYLELIELDPQWGCFFADGILCVLGLVSLISPGALAVSLASSVVSYYPRIVAAGRFRQSWLGALLHPVGLALFLAIQWYALAAQVLGYPTAWKGRGYLHRQPGPGGGFSH
jgi:hypothetical protein